MAKASRVGFKIPDQIKPDTKPFYANAKEVKVWAERLPVANIGETSRRVFKALMEFNRALIHPKERMMSVEAFREPVRYICSNLEKHFINVGFPLSGKARKIALLSRELCDELATAYKCVVEDLLNSASDKSDQKVLGVAIHRAMIYLSAVLHQSALVYEPYPSRIWRELHTLHRLARRYSLHALPVKDIVEGEPESSTIEQIYLRVLLYALASPYKLRQADNRYLYKDLMEWSQYARLYNQGEAPPEACFVVRQDADLQPAHHSLMEVSAEHRILLLDTRQLIEKLQDHFDDEHSSFADSGLLIGADRYSKGLLQQLISLWTTAPQREFVRTKLNFELRIAVGLAAIYGLLKTEEASSKAQNAERLQEDMNWISNKFDGDSSLQPPPDSATSGFTLIPIDTPRKDVRRSGFEEFGPNSRDEREPEPVEPIWGQATTTNASIDTHIFRTVNESAGGYCIDWRGSNPPAVKVGELIGIQSASSSGQFGVGLVRWMKNISADRLQVGLQMIAPNAVAISAQADGIPNAHPHECLLLPEVGTSGQPASFIGPDYPFNVGNKLLLDNGGNQYKIKLTRLLESTGAISQFQFTYVDHDTGDSHDREINEDSDFENIWSVI